MCWLHPNATDYLICRTISPTSQINCVLGAILKRQAKGWYPLAPVSWCSKVHPEDVNSPAFLGSVCEHGWQEGPLAAPKGSTRAGSQRCEVQTGRDVLSGCTCVESSVPHRDETDKWSWEDPNRSIENYLRHLPGLIPTLSRYLIRSLTGKIIFKHLLRAKSMLVMVTQLGI